VSTDLVYDDLDVLTEDQQTGHVFKDVLIVAITLLGAVIAAAIVLYGRDVGLSTGIGTDNSSVATAIFLSSLSAVAILYGLKKHPVQLARILVASVTLAGTVSGLVLFKFWLDIWRAPPALFLLALPIGYMGVRWSFQAYWGSLSRRTMNLIIVSSATLMGSLIGTSLPPAFTISFLAALAILDFLVVETQLLPKMIGSTKYGEITAWTTLPLETSLVGMGDFLAYSMLVATSFQLSGLYAASITIGLILVGVLATLEITRLRSRAPGLFIPVGLGIIPLVLALAT